jgi:hypothetical protein
MNVARFAGAYVVDWRTVSAAVRATTGNRCARCHHPFAYNGRPLDCDDRCDATRGRLIDGPAGEMIRNAGIDGPHEFRLPGLNFGVHHLDGRKDNNAWWNLLPLCNSCHLTIQAKVIPERPYLFAHSDWFKPYVAGFYAFYYGHVYITRDQADADLDRWLRTGQPWLYPDDRGVVMGGDL